jgi:hypothetical protein
MSKSREIIQTPTVTAGPYSAGDAVGGLLTFADAASVYKGDGTITKVVIVDDAKQAAHLVLALFDRTFTPTADNGAWDPTDADNQHCIGIIDIPAAAYGPGADNNVASVDCDLNFTLVAGGTSLFAQLYLVTSTPTYVATDDVTIKITVNR